MRNSILVYRLFDVAEEINLEQVEKSLAQRQPARMRLSRIRPKSIQFKNPPVTLDLGEGTVPAGNRNLNVTFTGKVYDLGVIAIIMRIPLMEDNPYQDAVELATILYDDEGIEAVFIQQLDKMRKILANSMVKEVHSGFVEDYTVFYFTDWDKSWDPIPLLLAEKKPVSEQVRRETLRNSFSYTPNDHTIITWDSALVCEPTGSTDIPDLLEFANSQLLELRYYDNLLTEEMSTMYDAIEEAQLVGSFRRLGHFRRIMNQLMELIADITEITERIDNSLKVTEDVFYARIYGAALSILRTRTWAESIERKVSIISQTYTMLSNRIVNQRSEILELVVIILILLELILGIIQAVISI